MAQKGNDKSSSGIGKHLGDLSPSKVVPVADEMRGKQAKKDRQ